MSNVDQRLQVILTVLLAKVTAPAVILVTAASGRDDSSLLSAGLAAVAKDVGYRAELVSLGDFSTNGRSYVQRDIDRFIAEKATVNDLVVVDAPSLLDTEFAIRVAQMAAGTVLALAIGRKVTAQDKRVADLLRLVGAKFLGVVATPHRPKGAAEAKERGLVRPKRGAAVGVNPSGQ